MTHSKSDKEVNAPNERTKIGTPAGESPEKGRKRHGTECLTDMCTPPDENRSRKVIEENEVEESLIEEGQEIGPDGHITGTHV